jgi:O-antigen biosynthesis protein
MKPGGPSCTIVVCTRNRPRELEACLDALTAQDYPRSDVLVIDNAPDAPVREICLRRSVAYEVEPIVGLSRARNRGARSATTDIVAYTDDDAIPERTWISELVAVFTNPVVAAAAGQVRYVGADRDWAQRPAKLIDLDTPGWFGIACFGGIGDGNNMAFRRSLFASGFGFDERLGRGAAIDGDEEHFAWATLIDRGHTVAYAPRAIVRHPFPPGAAERRALRVRDRRTLAAYVPFLWREFPSHRAKLIAYFLGSPRRIATRWARTGT